jgi:antirestriction protein ArdC
MTIYQEITDSIITELEKGAALWVKPWNAPMGADKNIVSQKPYRGINRLILAMRGLNYAVPVWGTYKQWEQLGGQVKKGEKGTKIVFWSQAKSTNPEGEEKAYAFAKAYFVFNVSQVEGIDIIPSGDTISDNARNESCDKRIAATGANIVHGGDTACYIPSADVIRMPELGVFQSSEHYYATAFHELAHWTSDKSRCDRDLSKGKFGNADYAFEELVAELSAAFLCQHHQIKGDLRHAGYIQSWLKALKSDSKAIFKASGLAQQATDFLLACSQEKEELIAA